MNLFLLFLTFATAQNSNVVLIESFTETGCGACSASDSAYQALMKDKSEKVAIINYHCFYKLDTFYQYNKACDPRYIYYKLKGFPAAIINGANPIKESSHITYLTSKLIDSYYDKPPNLKFNITCIPNNKNNKHSTTIKVKTTALKDISSKDLRLFIVVTESNINHLERYKQKSVYGINEFDNIMRAQLPDTNGIAIDSFKAGGSLTSKVSYTNDDVEINFKEVRIVVFVQDMTTGEVFGAAVTKEHPF